MKHINADRLRAEIERLKETHERNLDKPMERGRIGHAHGYVDCCDEFLAFIDSLQQEQPVEEMSDKTLEEAAEEETLVKTLDEAAMEWTDKWGEDIEERPYLFVNDAFKAGAKWMAGQGVTLKVTDDTTWGEVNDFIHRNCDGVKEIHIRKKEESK